MSSAAVGDEKSLRAEIQDLSGYIAGLPEALRTSGAFAPYEARLQELQEGLAVRELQNLDFPRAYVLELIEQQQVPEAHGSNWLVELREAAKRQENILMREIIFHDRWFRFLNAVTFIVAASAGAATLAAPIAGSLLAVSAATLAAILLFSGAFRRLAREQMDIAKLRVLRSELEDVFVRQIEHGLGQEDVRELSRRVVFLFSENTTGEDSPRVAGKT